jgi:hypothetical protein
MNDDERARALAELDAARRQTPATDDGGSLGREIARQMGVMIAVSVGLTIVVVAALWLVIKLAR